MSSSTETKLWVICPVCHKANPAGARFCEHCWGAAINQDATLTTEELAEVQKHRGEYLSRRKKIRIATISLGVLAIILSIYLSLVYFTDTVVKPDGTLNSSSRLGEWAMFRHSLDGTSSTGISSAVPQGTLKWSFPTGGPVQSSPAVAGGDVFFGSQDSRFYSVNADNGVKNWDFETGSWVSSSPAVSRGIVYFGSNDGKLYALNAQNGRKNWEFPTTFPVRSAPAIVGDTIYFGSEDYNLYALDVKDGARIWDFDTGSPAVSPPVISGGILFIGASDGYSYAFNAMNGQRRLRFASHYAVYAAPVVVDNTVYLTTTNGYVFAFNGNARTRLWEHEIKPFWLQLYVMGVPGISKPPSQSGFLWSTNLRGAVNASPVVSGNTIYVPLNRGIVAFDTVSLKKIWTFNTGGTIRSSPALANNILYFGSDDGKLYAVDAATGKKLWDYATGGPILSSPAVADGVVYFGSDDGNLYAIK